MTLAIDGSASGNWASGATIVSGTLTTTNPTDVLVCVVHIETGGTVSSISQPSGVGTWTKRKALSFTNIVAHDLEVWWAATTSTISSTITVTMSSTPDDGSINVFGVSGANTSSPWDSNVSLPATNHGTTGAASVTGVSTTNANDMLLGFMGWGDTATDPGNNTAGAMGGTTGTLIKSTDSAGIVCASEQRVVSATQSSISIAFGSSSTVEWLMIADAIVAASSGAAPTWGFSSRREDERPIAPQRSDSAQPWFYPSQIPVPTSWLPTTGQEDRPPPPSRRPDDSSIENRRWFVRSPNPVPTTWLPTTGEEDRPPPIKRPPDEPNGYFFQKPGAVAPPLRWMPTTGEEDRPPNPNRIRAPDEPPTWFRPSQIPVPQQWLPTAGEQDHPFPVKRPPDEPGTFFFQFSAQRTTPNVWLPTTGEEDRPPSPNRVPSPDQFFPWFVLSPNPVPTTWLPTTGEEDRPPAQKRPPDEPGTFFFQFSPPVGIAGIAWWRQTEVYLEPAPSYRDYKLSWAPQFVVQIAPTFVEIYSNEFLSPVGALGHIKRNP